MKLTAHAEAISILTISLLFLGGCALFQRPPATTWLGPSEPLDAIMLVHDKTGKTNVVIYGFEHTHGDSGRVVWKTVPLK